MLGALQTLDQGVRGLSLMAAGIIFVQFQEVLLVIRCPFSDIGPSGSFECLRRRLTPHPTSLPSPVPIPVSAEPITCVDLFNSALRNMQSNILSVVQAEPCR
jgi:hypothetical protein